MDRNKPDGNTLADLKSLVEEGAKAWCKTLGTEIKFKAVYLYGDWPTSVLFHEKYEHLDRDCHRVRAGFLGSKDVGEERDLGAKKLSGKFHLAVINNTSRDMESTRSVSTKESHTKGVNFSTVLDAGLELSATASFFEFLSVGATATMGVQKGEDISKGKSSEIVKEMTVKAIYPKYTKVNLDTETYKHVVAQDFEAEMALPGYVVIETQEQHAFEGFDEEYYCHPVPLFDIFKVLIRNTDNASALNQRLKSFGVKKSDDKNVITHKVMGTHSTFTETQEIALSEEAKNDGMPSERARADAELSTRATDPNLRAVIDAGNNGNLSSADGATFARDKAKIKLKRPEAQREKSAPVGKFTLNNLTVVGDDSTVEIETTERHYLPSSDLVGRDAAVQVRQNEGQEESLNSNVVNNPSR